VGEAEQLLLPAGEELEKRDVQIVERPPLASVNVRSG
jgi:hypothetical protein